MERQTSADIKRMERRVSREWAAPPPEQPLPPLPPPLLPAVAEGAAEQPPLLQLTVSNLDVERLHEKTAYVTELIAERARAVRALMHAVERAGAGGGGKKKKGRGATALADACLPPYLSAVAELREALGEVRAARRHPLLVRIGWPELLPGGAKAMELKILRNGRVCMAVPPDVASVTLECDPAAAASRFEVLAVAADLFKADRFVQQPPHRTQSCNGERATIVLGFRRARARETLRAEAGRRARACVAKPACSRTPRLRCPLWTRCC